jgi:lipoprotein-releasing system permease protein
MYKWFLAWRYLHTKLIAFIGVASVMLGVALLLVVVSVMGGFLDTIRARSKGLHSEIVLEGGTLQGFPYYDEFGAYLLAHQPDVVKLCTPAIYNYGIFRVPATTWTKPARVLGIRLEEYVQVNDFDEGLHYQRYYPGTTHLHEQPMPVAGVDEKTGRLRLPKELEEANAEWRKRETDPDEIAAYDATPFQTSPFPYVTAALHAERVFTAAPGEPGYEGPEYPGIIVGCDLLNARGKDGNFERYYARGTDIALTVMPLTQSGNVTGEPPIRLPLRYADDSRTGIYEIDSLCVYVDFDMLQHKLAMDPQPMLEEGFTKPRTNQLLIGLQDEVELNDAKATVATAWADFLAMLGPEVTTGDARLLDFVEVYTWEDLQRPFIAAVEKEKVLVTFMFGLMFIVVFALLLCIFYMIVEKKTRDIGVLKSLGASPQGVASLFIAYAAAVGIVGAILGSFVGSVFVWNINGIQDFLASLNPALRVWSPDVYSFDQIPEVVKRADALWIAVVAVLSSMLGCLIPAVLAGRVWPVQALRYE